MLQPVLVRAIGGGHLRADRRRAPVAGGQAGRAAPHPGHHPHRRRHRRRWSRPWWRTSSGRTSTRSTRPPPTSSSSRTSTSPTTSWPPAWARAGPPSRTLSGCSSSPHPCSGWWRTAKLTAGHARALLTCPDRAYQETLAQRAVAEGLSVRAVEEEARRQNQQVGRPRRRPPGPRPPPPPARAPGARGAAVRPPRHPGQGGDEAPTGARWSSSSPTSRTSSGSTGP